MKIILCLLILNIFYKVYTQFHSNFNYNQGDDNLQNYFNKKNNEQKRNLRNFEKLYYKTYQYPLAQKQLSSTNHMYNSLNSNQKTLEKDGYEIIQLTANDNTFIENQYNIPNNVQNLNVLNKNQITKPMIPYSTTGIQNPFGVHPQGRSLSSSSPEYFVNTQQYSNNKKPNSNILNSRIPIIDTRFDNDDVIESSNNYDKAKFKETDNLPNDQPSAATFQYQYNKGWSVHEAVSVNDIVIPHLEERKYSKYSTPNAPEAYYYQKFYNIYNYVEHQTKQYLGQYEMESINDDFNGRSIVAPGQYPHMAAIGFLSNEEKIEFKCGGSLISENFVITAAHCCYLNGETPIIVKLGIINLKFQSGNSDPQRRAIKEIIVHPSYNSTMNYHDIALLKLQAPVDFTKFVSPILLWSSDDIPYERVFTMGYGSTSFAKAPTNILTELSLSLIPLQKCKKFLPSDEKAPNGILESQICGRDLERNRDTCQGDSGGPLQLNLEHRKQRNTYRYYLVGIISYGDFCGSKKPGIYTRVSSYCKWIASMVWPNFEM